MKPKKSKKVLNYIAISLIQFYQKYLSFDTGLPRKLGLTRGFVCIYYPSCSEYTRLAIEKYGVGKGIQLGAKRIARCNPRHEPGVDLVP